MRRLLLLTVFLVPACSTTPPKEKPAADDEGHKEFRWGDRAAPDAEGTDSDDKPLSLRDYKGKVVMVDFWATWCGPCMALIPHEKEMLTRLKGKPFAVLGISADKKRKDLGNTEAFHEVPWRSIWDGLGGPIQQSWGIQSYPTIFLLDHRGTIRYRFNDGRAVLQGHLDRAVDELLKDVPPAQ